MIEFEFFENLLEFIEEFYELLKEDWRKFKLFIKQNKDYIIWLIIAVITLQFTDVMSLGSSWNRYCKKNNIQTGGGNVGPGPGQETEKNTNAGPEPAKEKTKEEAKDKKKKKKKKTEDTKKTEKQKKKDDKQAKKDTKASDKQAQKDAKGPEDSSKSKKMGVFDKLKGKAKAGVGQHGMSGPILGNLDGIFGALEGMFAFAALILIIIGILSLPVLIFIVITYTIIKKIADNLALF